MTIKELCRNQVICKKCPFSDACEWLDCNPPFSNDEDVDNAITRSINETAKILTESKEKLTNKEWVDLLQKKFNVSRTSAKEMLHAIMTIKRNDNFNKQFCGSRRKILKDTESEV